ncbi:efflux RND transporter permease subunit [bacterium]|nr:efflux RND transporter permease subunit [bacterium]
MKLTEVAIRRPGFFSMIFTGLAVLGFIGYVRMPVNLLPEMDWPMVIVSTVWPGAGPREVESMVSKPMEEVLSTIGGMKHIRSYNMENVSVILLEFEMTENIDVVTAEVQRKMEFVRPLLPDDAESPMIEKAEIGSAPILRISLTADLPEKEIFTLAKDRIKPLMEQVRGVATVEIIGGFEREIRVEADADRLAAAGVAITDLTSAVQRENLDFSAGKMYAGRQNISVRLAGKFQNLDDVRELPVLTPSGSVKLGELADVVDGVKEDRSISRLNGKASLGFIIVKQSKVNAIHTVHNLRDRLSYMEKAFPGNLHFDVAQDLTIFTRRSVNGVKENLLEAIFTVALVLLVFLHSFRNSFIILLAIPTSLITTFFVMYLLGYSINIVSLMAMGLVVGILVDDSIVVLENIHRHLHMGKPPRKAALDGRSEIGLAAIAITLVDVVVFLPIGLLTGVVGKIFREFAITVVIATLLSLFVSFTLTPLLASRLNRLETLEGKGWMGKFGRWTEIYFERLKNTYTKLLSWSLDHRGKVVLIVTAIFFAAMLLPGLGWIGAEFFPVTDRGEFAVNLEMPLGTSLEVTDKTILKLENYVRSLPEVEMVFATSGMQQSEWGRAVRAHYGQLQIRLVDKRERSKRTRDVMKDIESYCTTLPGVTAEFAEIGMFGGAAESPIQYEVKGANLDSVQRVADDLVALMKTVPGAMDVRSTYELGVPELRVHVDREKAAAAGLTLGEVGLALRNAIEGEIPTQYEENGKDFDLRVQLNSDGRNHPSTLGNLLLRNHRGEAVHLETIADIKRGAGPTSISRKDRERLVTVMSNLSTRTLGEINRDIQDGLPSLNVPDEVTIFAGGDVEMMQDMFRDMGFALLLAIIFVYMVMVSLFESYIHPFTVMFSIPVAVVGAFVGMVVMGKTFSMFSLIGILMLNGLVAKNAILLVDYTNTLRSRGKSIRDALLEAGQTRLRPILMTTMTMVFGTAPLAFSLSPGSEGRSGMGVVIIFGLMSSMLLTLVLVPIMYTFMERFRKHKEITTTIGT